MDELGDLYIRAGQDAVSVPADFASAEYITLKASDGSYNKFYLMDDGGGTVTFAIVANSEPASKLYVLGANGIYYQIILTELNGTIYAGFQISGADLSSTTVPWKPIIPADWVLGTSVIIPATAL